jgi:hypothetical protein
VPPISISDTESVQFDSGSMAARGHKQSLPVWGDLCTQHSSPYFLKENEKYLHLANGVYVATMQIHNGNNFTCSAEKW